MKKILDENKARGIRVVETPSDETSKEIVRKGKNGKPDFIKNRKIDKGKLLLIK